MLDVLKRFSKTAAPAAQPKGDEMSTTQLAEFEATIAQLTSSLSEATTTVTSLTASLKDATDTNTKMKAALDASETAQKELAVQAKAKAVAERTAKLEAVIGATQAAGMVVSLESLDDAAFDLVVASMATNFKKEEESPMFKEVGAAPAAKAEGEQVVSFTKFTK